LCNGGKIGGRSEKKAGRKVWERVESFGEKEDKEKKQGVCLVPQGKQKADKKISGKGLFAVCHL
jgi:hypothetical protein